MVAPRSNEIVSIRPFESSDAIDFVAAARESVTTVGKWMDWCHADYSIYDANAWIATCQANFVNGTAYEFAMIDANTGKFLGGGGVNQINTGHNFATSAIGCVKANRGEVWPLLRRGC